MMSLLWQLSAPLTVCPPDTNTHSSPQSLTSYTQEEGGSSMRAQCEGECFCWWRLFNSDTFKSFRNQEAALTPRRSCYCGRRLSGTLRNRSPRPALDQFQQHININIPVTSRLKWAPAIADRWRWAPTHLRVQVFSFHTQIGIDDIQANEQPGDDRAFLLHHQRVGLIELTAERREELWCCHLSQLRAETPHWKQLERVRAHLSRSFLLMMVFM